MAQRIDAYIYYIDIVKHIASIYNMLHKADTTVIIRMCCVLIRPPIPYITSSRCKRLHKFRPKKFLLHKKTNTRVPYCNDLNNLFF